MVQKLSTFLGTAFSETPLDSDGVRAIVQSETILLDSSTSGNYIKTLTNANGLVITGGLSHASAATIKVDSASVAYLTATQTLTNKTINLTSNTLSMTLNQLNAAVSGGASVASLTGTEILTNKTLTSPVINTPTIAGPLSITDITTFGLRDVTTVGFETRVVSNNVSPILSADRTLTLDVNNANRTISLTGNLTIGGNLTTSGAHATTLTTSGATTLTLPTSGTIITKDSSGNFVIAGTMTGDVNRDAFNTVIAGTYGSASLVPIITVDANGFIDSIGTVSVAGVSSTAFDSASGTFTISTADGGSYPTPVYTRGLTRTAVSAGRGIGYSSSTGVIAIDSAQITFFKTPLLNALKLVDGAGSGLDADLLDGQTGAHYRIDVYDATGTLLN
jgi:trimeric autotransporter adhesin